MSPSSSEEQALIARFMKGEREAFGAWYESSTPQLQGHLRGCYGPHNEEVLNTHLVLHLASLTLSMYRGSLWAGCPSYDPPMWPYRTDGAITPHLPHPIERQRFACMHEPLSSPR
jgi:hypothetical protein